MHHFPYATRAQLAELLHHSGLPADTPATHAFRILAHTPAVGAQVLQLVFALLTQGDLDSRLRELVILRVAQRCGGWYVWVQHVAIAKHVGVSEAQIAASNTGEAPPDLFNERQRAALAFTNELLAMSSCAEASLERLREIVSHAEVVELLVLVGYFRMLCGLMATLDVEADAPFGLKLLDLVSHSIRSGGAANSQAKGGSRSCRPAVEVDTATGEIR